MAKPPPNSPSKLSTGTCTSSYMTSGWPPRSSYPKTCGLLPMETPGVLLGTMTIDCWRCVEAFRSVLPNTTSTWHRSLSAPGAEPFRAVEHELVSLAINAQLDVGRIRGADIGFGHGEGRFDLALQQRCQPVPLDRLGAVEVEDLHVSCIGGGAVEHLGGEADLAELLGDGCVVEVGELRPRCVWSQMGQEQVSRGPALLPPPSACPGSVGTRSGRPARAPRGTPLRSDRCGPP